MQNSPKRHLRSLPSTPPKVEQRIQARELREGDEILVARGLYARVSYATEKFGMVDMKTDTGAKARMRPETLVSVKR